LLHPRRSEPAGVSHDKKFDVIVGAITMLLVCSAKVAAV
jgi:hypothetical protein